MKWVETLIRSDGDVSLDRFTVSSVRITVRGLTESLNPLC